MKMWAYQDKMMKKLKRIYQEESKKTQNRLQEAIDLLNIDAFNVLYSVPSYHMKRRINTYIEEWREKGYLKGYFGNRANSVYNKKNVKYSEVLELFIYYAMVVEQDNLKGKELEIFRNVADYYYMDGQKQAGKKPRHLTMLEFLALMKIPNSAGYTWEEYKGSTALRNTYELSRLATQEIQRGKKPNIFDRLFQKMIERQQNRKLCINKGKISGDADLTTIGINNMAKAEGMGDGKVRFRAVLDEHTTEMCRSLNNQVFNIKGKNTFKRYSKSEGKMKEFTCNGLVLGLNLPPINDNFHWCRSTIIYNINYPDEAWYEKYVEMKTRA